MTVVVHDKDHVQRAAFAIVIGAEDISTDSIRLSTNMEKSLDKDDLDVHVCRHRTPPIPIGERSMTLQQLWEVAQAQLNILNKGGMKAYPTLQFMSVFQKDEPLGSYMLG